MTRDAAIRAGLIVPCRGPLRDEPSPQPWLDEGAVLRTTKGVDIVERWTVPPTLRLLASDVREMRRAGLR